MMTKNIIKTSLRAGFILMIISWAFCWSLHASEDTVKEEYGYEKKDKAAEKKRFLEKLQNDYKKVDMAIENTKTLIDRSRNRPYLPEIYLRLAELYIEKSRIVYFIRKNQVSDSLKSLKQFESTNLKNQALEIYQRILDDFPTFEDRDKVHFFMAHEYRELGQIEEMVKCYREIITRYKNSRYVPESYLLLGDYFSNKADILTAISHYSAVLKYPESPAIVIARYKLAWCHINEKDHKKAIKLFEECVTSTAHEDIDVDTYRRVDIKLEAFVDMAYCYPEIYKEEKPEHAINYFKQYAWSRPVYTTVLEKLAYRYYIKKKWHHAATLYRELSELQHDYEKLLEYARNTFECVQEIGKFEEAEKDMTHIIKALKLQKYSIHVAEEEKKKNLTDFEIYARNIVTHLHDKARKEKSVASFKQAADAYKKYLDFFEDSPVQQDMETNYAETLFSSNQYLAAGKMYEKIAEDKTKLGMHTQDALYSTVISYYSALKRKEEMNYYETAYARDGLRTSGTLYAKFYPESKQVPDVLFNVAWIAYDEGNYDQAIGEFTEYLKMYPSGKTAKAAIHLTLDAYHLRENYKGLIKFGNDVLAGNMIHDPKFATEVRNIVKASESKIVSSMTVAAVNNWEQGSSELIEFAEENENSGLGEQALTALLVSGKEKGDLRTVYSTGNKIIKQYPNSENMESTLTIMIDSFSKAAQYRILAQYMETFAQKFPKHKNSPEFIYQAGYIREMLGEYKQSSADYRKYLGMGQKSIPDYDDIVFSMAQNDVDMGNAHNAISVLTSYRAGLSATGKVRADAWVSSLYYAQGDAAKAGIYRSKAKKAYRPAMGKVDEMVKSGVAGAAYDGMDGLYQKYMKISLGASIDNTIVAEKNKLMQSLEKGYLGIIQYESAQWALKACYRSFEINKEFASFLQNAPMPELSPEQKTQYKAILDKKIADYMDKADQYRNACVAQAEKWETCNPELAGYFLNNNSGRGTPGHISNFSLAGVSRQISADFFNDETLKQYHEKLMNTSDDLDTLMDLAQAYIDAGDYKQSMIIIKKAIEEIKSDEKTMIASAYNLLGLAYLYDHNDPLAKEALKQAISEDPEMVNAKINLAGLYTYYGHEEKAQSIYDSIGNNAVMGITENTIHPRAKELYDDTTKLAKNENL